MYPKIADNTLQTKNGERGAALITVLFISTLLLAAGGVLILVTGTASRTAIDSTAEMQAYYSAEAGLESTLNVIRGNIAPNASMPAGTKINFRNAVTLSTSNLSTDTSTRARLSGWLNYSGTNPDRVPLTAGYIPMTGLAYGVDVSDPDNTPVASGEPSRLLLRVTGYGPKNAVKRLELIVRSSNFDYNPPCVICLRSADDGTPINFTTGNSAAKEYSGVDRAGHGDLPAFGATLASDTTIEVAAANKNTVTNPIAATISMSSLPSWLQTADEARAFLADQKANAIMQGRYFTSFSGYSGSDAAPAFTFVDGDCTLDGGAGLLIITGNLEMNGNPSFTGLILVLGDGSVNRDGGGNGNIFGAIAVARFSKNGSGGFLGPTFNTNGGGNSTVQNDSNARRKAEDLTGPRVLGVHEY
ncbi:MAG TPA: hypothetical protein VEM96_20690 [Pyrinomonadaceae bacterium]|nr:hypothetical protein [Pyrinomonadaceae bacterium]